MIHIHVDDSGFVKSTDFVLRGVASVAYFITGHEQTQYNRVAAFIFFGVFHALKGPIQNLLIFTAAVLCRLTAVKRLPKRHQNAEYIFWSFGFILSYFKTGILLKPVLVA